MYTVSESNSSATTNVGGSVAPGSGTFSVLGIASAGTSSGGVGQQIVGTYGTLVLNANGTFSYSLNNNDPDTNVLGQGMSGTERFTYTYSLNGVVQTATIEFQVNGVNEAGQVITSLSSPLLVTQSLTIGQLEQINVTAEYGILVDGDWGEVLHISNNGAIRVDSTTYQSLGVGSWDSEAQEVSFTNNGLIEVANNRLGAIAGGISTNNGVIRVTATGAADPTNGLPPGNAIGPAVFVNTGTIEVTALHSYAIGTESPLLNNSGYIYVSGATDVDDHPYTTGVKTGATGAYIHNSGTIHAVSTSSAASIGIDFFLNGSNAYSYGTVINSGTIVADIAVRAIEGHATGIHVINSGRIEGDLLFQHNLNVVQNLSGGVWVGELHFGLDQDVFVNSGTVTGNVYLGAGEDLYDGRGGGTVSGIIDAGDYNDMMRGGGAAERLNGGGGDDRIYGGGGADTLSGFIGADAFVYAALSDSTSAARDTITDFETGVDKIDLTQLSPSSITITPSGGYSIVNAVVAGGTLSIRVQGTIALSDVVTNSPLGNQYGTSGNDILEAIVGDAELYGGDSNDALHGNAGNNYLDGGYGADTLYGGNGNDRYLIVDGTDRIIEFDDSGIDEVQTWVDYSLANNVENATLLGSSDIGVLGNSLDNLLVGNAGRNVLRGWEGNDVLIGGLGADALEGGWGADRYVYLSAQDSTAANADHLVSFDHGLDVIDLTAVAPVAYTFIERPSHNFGSWPWASVFSHFTEVRVQTESGATMTIWVKDLATLADFSVNALLNGTEIDDNLIGSEQANEINGQGGNDTISGLGGNDVLHGNDGLDTLSGGGGADQLYGGGGNDGLSGGDANDYLDGSDGDDTLTGGAGDDDLEGGVGNDTLDGGAGSNDWANYSNNVGAVTVNLGLSGPQVIGGNAGTDTLANIEHVEGSSYADRLTGNSVANWLSGGWDADVLNGAGGEDRLYGGEGNDRLDGGAGADRHYGGDGNDVYIVENALDIISEYAGEGIDLVNASVSYALRSNIENLTLTGSAAIDGTGNGLDNALRGNGAANLLDGGSGEDMLLGNGGNDTLLGGSGNDVLNGGAGADIMTGGLNSDTYYVDTLSDVVTEEVGEGTDTVVSTIDYTLGDNVENLTFLGVAVNGTGNALNNTIRGSNVANTLDGGAGADHLYGYAGDDVYIVDNLGDRVGETTNFGIDTVLTSVSFKLGANVENLTLTGSSAINGTGNGLSNMVVGNDGANSLHGQTGNDTLGGNGGDDVLNGGGGADSMSGGAGDDIYYVDNAGDMVIENGGEGLDTVKAGVDWTLGANQEELNLTGWSSIDATGNELSNVIRGNGGANSLDGAAGVDIIFGGSGNDILIGGAGRDTLVGGAGSDSFLFRDGDFGATTSTADRITDFAADDTIDLSLTDANSSVAGDQGFNFVGAAAFSHTAGELRYEQIGGNTFIQGDVNGDGTADFMIRLDGLHTLDVTDFIM